MQRGKNLSDGTHGARTVDSLNKLSAEVVQLGLSQNRSVFIFLFFRTMVHVADFKKNVHVCIGLLCIKHAKTS